MKIIPNITVQDADKDGQRIYYPPGIVVDLPKPAAQDLIERGFAVLPGQEEAVVEASGPSVTSESGAQITATE